MYMPSVFLIYLIVAVFYQKNAVAYQRKGAILNIGGLFAAVSVFVLHSDRYEKEKRGAPPRKKQSKGPFSGAAGSICRLAVGDSL